MESIRDLHEGVREAYSEVARQPRKRHPFPVGRTLALDLGYTSELLDAVPAMSLDAFAGVSNLSVSAEIPTGACVLDLGCGAGLDSIIAARRVGAAGRVVGVDFSPPMILRAQEAASAAGLDNVEFHVADACELPQGDAQFDVALVNGILNLNTARRAILEELARVVRPGGVLYLAELILVDPPTETKSSCASNWFA